MYFQNYFVEFFGTMFFVYIILAQVFGGLIALEIYKHVNAYNGGPTLAPSGGHAKK